MFPSAWQGQDGWVRNSWNSKAKHFLMDGNGDTTISHLKVWNRPIETTIYKWLFQVLG